MKKTLIASAFILGLAHAVLASGVDNAIIEPEVIEAAAAESSISAKMFVVLSALIVFAAAAN